MGMGKNNIRKTVIRIIVLILFGCVITMYVVKQVGPKIVQSSVSIDYGVNTATAGKYVFGISSWPRMNPEYAGKLAEAGVTIIRQSSLLLSDIVPATTLEDYKNNINNVQDPNTWNWNLEGKNTETMHEADVARFQDAGIKVFSILSGIPGWLGYDGVNSMPQDWDVYEDLEKKLFDHYQDKISYFEIFNEPEIELNLKRSPYTDIYKAYRDLYYHSAKAISEVRRSKVQIGGPANLENSEYLRSMLSDPEIRDLVDFASWHRYGEVAAYSGGVTDWKYEAIKQGKKDLALFVTEYNIYDSQIAMDSPKAVSWVAGRLSAMMAAGATGAFLYGTDDRADGLNAEIRHKWKIINQDGSFTPRVWPIRLLSMQLGLGAGDISMKDVNYKNLTFACAAVTAKGSPVFWLVNDTEEDVKTEIGIDRLGLEGEITLTHFLACGDLSDGSQVYKSENKNVKDSKLAVVITVPGKSLYGVKISK